MNKHQSYARRSTMAVGVTSQPAPVPERVYRVILTLPMTERPALSVADIRDMFPFLGKLHSAHPDAIRGKRYMFAIFDASDPDLPTKLNNALIVGRLSAYRVQLVEAELND